MGRRDPARHAEGLGRFDERDAAERVEVAYALPDRQCVVTLDLPPAGLTAGEAVQRSGLLQEFPQITGQPLALAVFGVACDAGRPLHAGDRVEILRPLRHDPRASRRERAALASSRKSRRR